MKMEKCILVMHKPKPLSMETVRLRPDAAEIIRQIQCETGLSASYIIGEMIKFCEDKIEIKEVQ